jgi:hypothetical protein
MFNVPLTLRHFSLEVRASTETLSAFRLNTP